MSSSKSKINIEKAIRQLQISKRYQQQDYALAQISTNCPLKLQAPMKNKDSQQSRKSARKSVSNKQNQSQLGIPTIKNITYTTLSKTLQHKNYQINHQQHQIQLLKRTLQEEKNKKDDYQVEESRIKCQQLVRLKLKEKQHLQNLREVKMLKANLEDIRKKYEQMSNQKNAVLLKYNCLLTEHQQLTTTILALKEQHQVRSKDNRCVQLEEQLTILKEQVRQEHLQKESIEARANNFEKRMSQYIIKFNQSQQHYNNCQIKYYKLQKDCDNLRVDKEESEQKYYNIERQIKSERQINEEQVSKLRLKLKRLQEQASQQQISIAHLKEIQRKRYSQSQQLQKLNKQLQNIKEQHEKLKDDSQMEAKKWQNYIKQLTKQYSQQKDAIVQELNYYRPRQAQQNEKLKEAQEKLNQLAQFNRQLQVDHRKHQSQIQSLRNKCEDLISENQRIFNHYSALLFQKDEQIKRNRGLVSHLQIELQDKGKQQQMILSKINQLQGKISQGDLLHQRIIDLQSQNSLLTQNIQKIKSQYQNSIRQKQEAMSQITQNNIGLAEQLNKCNLERLQVDVHNERKKIQSQFQNGRLKQLQEQYTRQKKYYQQKYQKQLQEYNNLSKYFRQIEQQNTNLLSTNTANIIEISNLKGQIAILHSDLSRLANTYQNTSQNSKKAQIALINNQLGHLKKQVQSLLQELSKHQITIKNLEEENKELKAISKASKYYENYFEIKNVPLDILEKKQKSTLLQICQRQIAEKDQIIAKIKKELELHIQEIRKLNYNISVAQQNYCSLVHKYQSDAQRWQQQKLELQEQWANFNYSNEEQKRELYHSRITVAYELDNSQNTIAILKKENIQLQRIFGEQIQRRNGIIRQLIKQKKSLYGQFVCGQD